MMALAKSWTDGRLKLGWTHHLLDMRKRYAKVFTDGDFRPLAVEGAHRGHVIAFARTHRSGAVVVAALRHFAPLTDGGMIWPALDRLDARVDLGGLSLIHPAVAGRTLDLKHAFDRLPVALLSGRIGRRIQNRSFETAG